MAKHKTFTWVRSHKVVMFGLLLVVIVAVVGILSVVRAPGRNNNATPANNTVVTRTGKVVCLPHKGDGPSTMECAFGLKVENKYYGLKDEDSHPGESPISGVSEKQVEATGTFTQTNDKVYDTVGTISITKLKVLE